MFIRGVMPDFTIYEEFITWRFIHGSTKGTDMFLELHATLEEAHLDPSKLFGVATDGWPFIKKKIKPNLHYTCSIMPKGVTSGGAHLHDLAPGLHSSEETSQGWRKRVSI